MNLSHVERYFADLLSAIESRGEIPLYSGSARTLSGKELPRNLAVNPNVAREAARFLYFLSCAFCGRDGLVRSGFRRHNRSKVFAQIAWPALSFGAAAAKALVLVHQ